MSKFSFYPHLTSQAIWNRNSDFQRYTVNIKEVILSRSKISLIKQIIEKLIRILNRKNKFTKYLNFLKAICLLLQLQNGHVKPCRQKPTGVLKTFFELNKLYYLEIITYFTCFFLEFPNL